MNSIAVDIHNDALPTFVVLYRQTCRVPLHRGRCIPLRHEDLGGDASACVQGLGSILRLGDRDEKHK